MAFVVRAANLAENTLRDALFTVGVAGYSRPSKLVDEESISNVRWSPDGRWISYLSAKTGSVQLWVVGRAGGRPRQLIDRPAATANHRLDSYKPLGGTADPAGLLGYEWSPTGRLIAYATSRPISPQTFQDAVNSGILYDDATMAFVDLVAGSWMKNPTQLRVFDLVSGGDHLLWEVREDIAGFAWAPDESRLAVSYGAPPVQKESMVFFNHDIGVVELNRGSLVPVATTEADEVLPAWSPDGKSLAFAALLDNWNSSLQVVDLQSGSVRKLADGKIGYQVNQLGWGRSSESLLYEAPDSGTIRRGKSALYEVSLETEAIRQVSKSQGHLSGCHFDAYATTAACILQGWIRAPDPAVVDLETGVLQSLAELHPEFRNIALGTVSELHWRNRYGHETNGFLVKPVGYTEGKRYPTLVLLYGFEGKFIADAEWLSSYPAQAFARDGFAVLMLNYPRVHPWTGADFSKGTLAWGRSPLASIQRGVELLVEAGIADSTRLGILGWSYGCFLAEFAITQTDLFRAASVGNGGDYNPGIYWVQGRRAMRVTYERVMGGPPYGETLANWIAFSPAFNVHRARSPVLMEFNPLEAIVGLEMFTAFRRHNVPVELVIYPGEGHVFVQPRHRYHSMERNLDWFNFWLRGRENEHPSKREQYARWRAMRTTVAARKDSASQR